jgi:hypothetical protein
VPCTQSDLRNCNHTQNKYTVSLQYEFFHVVLNCTVEKIAGHNNYMQKAFPSNAQISRVALDLKQQRMHGDTLCMEMGTLTHQAEARIAGTSRLSSFVL